MEKVLALYGGHRRHGNTETILDRIIHGLSGSKFEAEKIVLTELDIHYCTSCYSCGLQGRCCIKDDMWDIYDKIKCSSIIILASPIYFGSVSSVSKIMMDRCQAFWSAKYIAGLRDKAAKKRGYFVATAGSGANDAFQAVKYTVRLFFLACGATYSGELLINGTDKMPAAKNMEILEKAAAFGREII